MTAIIFDTETHDRDQPEIIEAAWCQVEFETGEKGRPASGTYIPPDTVIDETGEDILVETIHVQRFKPSKPITLGAMATHGIMDEDLADCDPSSTFELPASDYLIGHNIDFDWNAAGSPPGAKRICTCALARAIWEDMDCYSQSALIYYLDRQNARQRLKAAHGAAADVLLCKTILDAIIAKTGVQSLEELWLVSEKARVPKILSFGKHKGMKIKEAPQSYLDWLLKANDPPIDPYLRRAILEIRGQKELL